MNWSILVGNALERLKGIPSNTIHAAVTSPPYWPGQRDYGGPKTTWGQGWVGCLGDEPDPFMFVDNLASIFEEVRRVLRPDGTLWVNIGDSFAKNNKLKHLGFKEGDLLGVPWLLAQKLRNIGWHLRNDDIWCLSGSTKVYCRTNGTTQVNDLYHLVRDYDPSVVELWNGTKWTKVKKWWESTKKKDALRLTLRNGEKINCSGDHRFPTNRGLLEASSITIGDCLVGCKLPDECSDSPQFVPDDVGWLIGLYLAEGCYFHNRDGLRFSLHKDKKDLQNKIRDFADKYAATCEVHDTSDNGCEVHLYGSIIQSVVRTYVSGDNSSNKHLRPAALRRNNLFLDSVIKGYLDGDGHYDAPNDRWRLGFVYNRQLNQDIRVMCARLGFSVRIRSAIATNTKTGKKYPCFRGDIRFQKSNHGNVKDDREVVKITRTTSTKFFDLEVEDEPNLFALASGTLTHNCKTDAMPRSTPDTTSRSHEYIFQLAKTRNYFFDREAIRIEEKKTKKNKNPKNHYHRSVWNIATANFKGQHFACVDELTECLTTSGWKSYDQINVGDDIAQFDTITKKLRWGKCQNVHSYHVQNEDLVAAKSRDFDLLLTPNHRTLVRGRERNGKRIERIITASELKKDHHIPVSSGWEGDFLSPVSEEWAELIGWYISEGHDTSQPWTVEIYQSHVSNPEHTQKIRYLLNTVEADFEEATTERIWRGRRADMTAFKVRGFAASRLRQLSSSKAMPADVLMWNDKLLLALMRGLVGGDGHTRKDDGRQSWIQKDSQRADLTQAIGVRLGFATKITRNSNCQTSRVYFTDKDTISLRGTGGNGAKIGTVKYTGIVWCPTTETGTFLARRNGRSFITGNSFPLKLAETCIKASTSEMGVCAACGAPSIRVVEKTRVPTRPAKENKVDLTQKAYRDPLRHITIVKTVGWEKSCSCGSNIPCTPATVLDPFNGAGTTGIAALLNGRNYIGCELFPEYAEQSKERILREVPDAQGNVA